MQLRLLGISSSEMRPKIHHLHDFPVNNGPNVKKSNSSPWDQQLLLQWSSLIRLYSLRLSGLTNSGERTLSKVLMIIATCLRIDLCQATSNTFISRKLSLGLNRYLSAARRDYVLIEYFNAKLFRTASSLNYSKGLLLLIRLQLNTSFSGIGRSTILNIDLTNKNVHKETIVQAMLPSEKHGSIRISNNERFIPNL